MTKAKDSINETGGGGFWAIASNGYIQYDLDTGLLEVYVTKQLAQANAKQGDIVREVSVNPLFNGALTDYGLICKKTKILEAYRPGDI